VRAGAESSRTTASVGSLGEQTLFAQRSPDGHPKSEIGSQVCLAAAISVCGPAVHRAKQGASPTPQMLQTDVDRATETPAPAWPRRVVVLDPRPIGRPAAGVAERRSPAASARSPTVPLRAIAEGVSVNDPRRCQRRRQHGAIGGDAHGFAVRLGAGVRLSTVRSSTRPPLARARLSSSLP
jgi:hypothetical protein